MKIPSTLLPSGPSVCKGGEQEKIYFFEVLKET